MAVDKFGELVELLQADVQREFDAQAANSNFVTAISRLQSRRDNPDQIKSVSALQFEQFIGFVNSVMRGHAANPSLTETVERLDAAYSEDALRARGLNDD